MGQSNGNIPSFRRGSEFPNADQLNHLGRGFVHNVRGGPGVSVKRSTEQTVVSIDAASKRRVPGLLLVTIDSHVGAGLYTWTKVKGEGPQHGTAAGTNVPDRLANEANLKTDVEIGKKVLLYRIASKWYFVAPAPETTAGDGRHPNLAGYPVDTGVLKAYGGFGYIASGSAGWTFSNNIRQNDGTNDGSQPNMTLPISSGPGAVPRTVSTLILQNPNVLATNWPGVGPNGFKLWMNGLNTGATGVEYKVVVTFWDPRFAPTFGNWSTTVTATKTFPAYDSTSAYTALQIPQATFVGKLRPKDSIQLKIEVIVTANGSPSFVNTSLALGFMELDCAG